MFFDDVVIMVVGYERDVGLVVRVFDPSLLLMRDIAADSMNDHLFIDYSILHSVLYVCIGSEVRWLLFMAAVLLGMGLESLYFAAD
jgi:hypothetical protein